MPSAKAALETSLNNPHDRWSGAEGSAQGRITERLVVPMGKQTFTAKPGGTFFAIGSCFARNVEERLEMAGADVTSRKINMRNLGDDSAREGGVFNKYTPVSILQELKWAAGIEHYPETALLEVGKDSYYDPYLSGKAARGTKSEMMARRAEVGQYFAQAFEADVVILTLGLIESWTDKETGLSLNEAPSPKLLVRSGERFLFDLLSLEQCQAAFEEICALFATHGKPGQKKIVTVSPVPLGRTFSEDDIIIANATSKATLRVAAKRVADQTDDLDYFPSYEAVMHSDPNLSWQRDRRHVSDVVVGRIIAEFMKRYGVADEPEMDLESYIDNMKDDPSFRKWSTDAPNEDALMAQMNEQINRYKNMVIKLQKELRQHKVSDGT
jgi:hypothetical protein